MKPSRQALFIAAMTCTAAFIALGILWKVTS